MKDPGPTVAMWLPLCTQLVRADPQLKSRSWLLCLFCNILLGFWKRMVILAKADSLHPSVIIHTWGRTTLIGISRLSGLVSLFLAKCGLECCEKEKIRCLLPCPSSGPQLLICKTEDFYSLISSCKLWTLWKTVWKNLKMIFDHGFYQNLNRN